ncbi:MAG TPA: hypothetical protein VFY13_07715, partial [Luteolibacter sp.]|nr:hypothetical protein [Luteolibacter sp.]
KVFINGKPLVESTEGLGRRGGDTIRGGWLTSDFASEFAKGPVTISCITFLRYGDRAIVQMPPLPQGIFSMWIEERKLPPLDSSVLQKAVEHVPMMTSEWKAPAADASGEEASEVGIYHYDGKFVSNPAVIGRWQVLGVVDSIDAFAGGAKPASGRTPFRAIEFKDGGFTDSNAWFWSGAMLFDLDRASALKVTPKAVAGVDHLLIEAGGWGPKMPPNFKPQWVVLKRQ